MKQLFIILSLITPMQLSAQWQIEGLIVDDTGEPIIGATVTNDVDQSGTLSDLEGKFSLTVPKRCQLVVSHVNFDMAYQNIENAGFIKITLQSKPVLLEELSVEALEFRDKPTSDLQKIENISAIFGEKDIIKYLITLPGISSISTFDAGITVRGGSTSENAFLIDGMGIADPRHLTTLVTSYDPYVLGKSSIYKSGQPAQYNGFLSGYVDMSPGLNEAFDPQAELSVGLISSSIKAKTPLGKNGNHAIAVSARASYLHLIAKMYERELEGTDFLPDYFLKDLTFTYQGKLGNGWNVSTVGLLSSDDLPIVLNENQSHQLYWSTLSGVMSIDKTFANQDILSLKIGGNGSETSDQALGRIRQSIGSESRSYTGSIRYNKRLVNGSVLAGLQHERKAFRYADNPDESNPSFRLAEREYDLSSFFVSATRFLNDVTFEGGINATYFNGENTALNISPRLKIHYLREWEYWIDYARTLQYEERLPFFTIRSPIDMPIPLGKNNVPAISDQISIGIGKSIYNNWNFTTSLFYKYLSNLKDFANTSRSNLDFISIEMIEGKGHSYGMESELSFSSEKIHTSISYTLLQAKRQFEAINEGRAFSPPYDVTNSITIQSNYQINDNWRFSALWTYTSGIHITIPEGIAVAKDITRPGSTSNYVPIYNERYNYRLPARHRLDLSLDYLKKLGKNAIKLSAGTYNTYGRNNIDFVYIEVEQVDQFLVNFVPKSKLVLPFVPYLSFTFYLNNHGA